MNETLSFGSREEQAKFIIDNPAKKRKCSICKENKNLSQMMKTTDTTQQGKRWLIGHRCNDCRNRKKIVGNSKPHPIQKRFSSAADRDEWAEQDDGFYECRRCDKSKRAVGFAKVSYTDYSSPYRFDYMCRACKTEMTTNSRSKSTASLRGIILYRLTSIKNRAKVHGLEFDLDADFITELWNNQLGRCYYSGREMKWVSSGTGGSTKSTFSVDRVDPNGGYTRDNVVLCLNHVNSMKSNLSRTEFLQLVSEISQKRSDNANLN